MRILAIDTALGACSACVASDASDAPLAHESIGMERGHAEALLPLVDRVMARVDGGFSSLERVAVTVGPGSYTGLRVGLAAARAIGLAVAIPVVGVTTLSALLAPLVSGNHRGVLAAAIDARHGQVYIQAIAPGARIIIPPMLLSLADAVRLIGGGPVTLAGSGAPALAAEATRNGLEAIVQSASAAPEVISVARIGLAADPAQALPKPLYLRAPDAAPQERARLPRR